MDISCFLFFLFFVWIRTIHFGSCAAGVWECIVDDVPGLEGQ